MNTELNEDKLVNYSSFEIIKDLGEGAFGKVYLVKKKDNGQLFALKTLLKKNLILKKRLRYAIAEANILKNCNHPFILKLNYAFQTPQYLYFAMEYCPGRDLLIHIMKKGTFSNEEAKFYIAELVLAIEYLHNMDIVYRDLKPENILLDEKGHIKLADFGLSKENMGTEDVAMSFCGSPAYLSPEMVQRKGSGRAADIYGIGAILYELVVGRPAFFNENLQKMYKQIMEGKLSFPKNIDPDTKDFITALMNNNPNKRIGVLDKNELKKHPFFNGIDFNLIYKKKYIPPYIDLIGLDRNLNDKKLIDFDYVEENKTVNRVRNFTFIRE